MVASCRINPASEQAAAKAMRLCNLHIIKRMAIPVCACLLMADAVEKVGGILLRRNNRIVGVHFLNRTCAFRPHFESMLLRNPLKIFFRQHRPKAAVDAIDLHGSYQGISRPNS